MLSKTVIEYKERDGKTFKVTRKVKVTKVTKWFNEEMVQRKTMEKFGKAKITSEGIGAQKLSQAEDAHFDLCKKAVVLAQSDNAEDKFLEDALKGCENLFKEKKVWTDQNRLAQLERDNATDAPAAATTDAPAADAPVADGGPKKYVPPSVKAAMENGKGGGKGGFEQEQEASLRVTNLSEICEDDTLRALFGTCGRLRRVFLSKDLSTGLCKGFAFVTYERKEMAEKAIQKLNGHGLDNLIMQVQWAKPRT
jgi:translation initiation factor 3 subunit G